MRKKFSSLRRGLSILAFGVFILSSFQSLAQSGSVSASIDSNKILIGDQVHFTITYTAPKGASIIWPVFKDTLTSKIEIVQMGSSDSVANAGPGKIQKVQVFTITCFDSGSFVIPPIAVSHRMPNDTQTYTSYTTPLTLYVNTVAVDTTQAIKDIKEPLTSPLTLMEILPWVGGGLLLVAILAIVIYFIIRRKRKQPLFVRSTRPALPAHLIALQALEELRLERLWQQGKIKEYHSALSEIIRGYLENRYGVTAMEMITPEVLMIIEKQKKTTADQHQLLKKVLDLSDMVKFAKYIPLPDEHDGAMQLAIQFINVTAEVIAEPQAIQPSQDFITNELNQQDNGEKK